MGIDKSLSDLNPSIIINGREYHYGKEQAYGEYLVEHSNNAKDYWCFKEEADLRAFLINLPESADNRGRIRAAYPDWQDVTDEQRTAYLAEDRAGQRSLAEEKVRNGTAPSYNMDLEGNQGPYEPQQIQKAVDQERPIQRVERQLAAYKLSHAPPDSDPRLPEGKMGDLIHGMTDHSFERGLSEAGKLRVLEGEIDWSGVSADDKKAVLSREVDFARIAPEQFEFVYKDIASDKFEPADSRVASQLFVQALSAEQQADSHAARVRDYGAADASTYGQRVKDGAMMPPASGPPHPWPSEVAKETQRKQAGQEPGKRGGSEKANDRDDGNSM
jgi:hypothetical protein